MNLTRRSFLKGLTALAAVTAVPVEIATVLDTLQTAPVNPAFEMGKNIAEGIARGIKPQGYLVLNGVVIPALAMEVSLINNYTEWYDGFATRHAQGPRELDLSLTTLSPNIPFDWQGRQLDFEVYPANKGIAAAGKAYLARWRGSFDGEAMYFDIELRGTNNINWYVPG